MNLLGEISYLLRNTVTIKLNYTQLRIDCIRLGLDEVLIEYTFHHVVPNTVYDRFFKKIRCDFLYPRTKRLAKTKEIPVR